VDGADEEEQVDEEADADFGETGLDLKDSCGSCSGRAAKKCMDACVRRTSLAISSRSDSSCFQLSQCVPHGQSTDRKNGAEDFTRNPDKLCT
jgi:hypothetical protein